MEDKLVFCVSVISGENALYGPDWKEIDANRSLIDLFLQVCGTKIVGQQVQVLVSKERSFLEAAVVQVSSPLKTLSKKKQIYIQFVVKEEMPVQKDFYSLYQEEMKKTYSNLNILHGSNRSYTHHTMSPAWKEDSSLPQTSFREENGVRRYDASATDEPTSIHSLTTRTSFENMTVEEICEEIRKIKSAEVSKNKFTSWVEETSKKAYRGLDQTKKVNHDSKKLNDENDDKSLQVSTSAEKIKQYTKLTESVKNKLNNSSSSSPKNTPKTTRISERLSKLAQPRRRTCELTKVNNLKSNHKQLPCSNDPITPSKNTNRRVAAENKRRTCSPSMTRGSTVNSTFIKTGVKITRTPKRSDKTTKSTEYFVEIFTKEKQNKVKQKPAVNKKRDDYSVDSLMNQTSDKSSSLEKSNSTDQSTSSDKGLMEFSSTDQESTSTESHHDNISVNEALRQIQSDTLESQHADDVQNSSMLSTNLINAESAFGDKSNSTESSPEEVIFDKSNISTHEKKESLEQAEVKEQGYILDQLPENSQLNSPEKTSAISHLQSDNMQQNVFTPPSNASCDPSSADMLCNVTSQDLIASFQYRSVSVDNIPSDIADYTATAPTISKKLSKSFDSIEECRDLVSLPNKSSLNLTRQNSILHDSPTKDEQVLSSTVEKQTVDSIGSSGTNLSNKSSSNSFKACSDILSSISNIDVLPSSELNRTFVVNDRIDQEREHTKPAGKPTNLPLGEGLSILEITKSPDKHRRQWGSSIEGLDHILLPSLQVFSLELRSTAESVASKLRVLYEDWQAKNDDIEEDGDPSTKPDVRKPLVQKNTQEGEQKEIAIVFRNLRKVEVKLKTMEQAAAAMIHSINENDQRETSPKLTIQRAKSFKWKELKHTARHQTRSKDWQTRQTSSSKLVSDEGSDSDG